MTADEAMPEHDCKATNPAVIVQIIRRTLSVIMRTLSVVMRSCLIVIDVPTIVQPMRIRRRSGVHLGIPPVLSPTSIEGAFS